MNFTLKIMGTASAMPISEKNPSAQLLKVNGRLFLIDCGEGTQQQIRRSHESFLRIEAIFISHVHGDHVFGLFGLLSTMSMLGRTSDLYIYGPGNLGPILKFYQSYFCDEINFEIKFTQIKANSPEVIHTSKNVQVSAFPLKHKIECYGYRFDEIVPERRRSMTPFKASSYAYCSDTTPFDELADWVHGVDVLYHEATYPVEFADKAVKHFHSTTHDAARCALAAGVGRLLVGHYSSRIRDYALYEQECRSIFPNSHAVTEFDEISF